MNVNQLIRLPIETFSESVYHLEFKDLASLEQSCTEIKAMICEKGIWEKLCEQYGLKDKENIKTVLFA